MMIRQVRRDTGAVPLFTSNLDIFRVTIPRASLVTEEFRRWAAAVTGARELSPEQLSALALAREGYDIDAALLRRLGLSASAARSELGQLADLGVLLPRKARDVGTYRLSPGLPERAEESAPCQEARVSATAFSPPSPKRNPRPAKNCSAQSTLVGAALPRRWMN